MMLVFQQIGGQTKSTRVKVYAGVDNVLVKHIATGNWKAGTTLLYD